MRAFKKTPLILFVACLFLVISCETKIETISPNIIFILTDDLGFEDLSSYGSKITHYP